MCNWNILIRKHAVHRCMVSFCKSWNWLFGCAFHSKRFEYTFPKNQIWFRKVDWSRSVHLCAHFYLYIPLNSGCIIKCSSRLLPLNRSINTMFLFLFPKKEKVNILNWYRHVTRCLSVDTGREHITAIVSFIGHSNQIRVNWLWNFRFCWRSVLCHVMSYLWIANGHRIYAHNKILFDVIKPSNEIRD